MVKKIKQYIKEAIEKYNKGISIDEILLYLRSEQIPPNYSSVIIAGVLEIEIEEAYKIVYNSLAYKDMAGISKKITENFLDALDAHENKEPSEDSPV